jgi:transposase
VGERTLSRWLRADREEGRREPKVPARGRVPIGGADAALAELVAEQSDATLAEYADRLAARAGVRRSLSAVCRALKSLGLVRKKRRSGPPSRTAGTWSRRGRAGAPSWPGSTPAAWSSSTLGSGAAEGIDTRMARTHARAARGRRALGKVPWGSTAALSMGAADNHRGARPG